MYQIYHYTTGRNLNGILAEGTIYREGERGMYGATFKNMNVFGIPACVWLTREREMPFTATPMITDESGGTPYRAYQMQTDRGYQHWQSLSGGVYRLCFYSTDVNAMRYWTGPVRDTLAKSGYRAVYEKVAKMGGDDLRAWYHCLEPVSMSNCLGIEKWIAGSWASWFPLTQSSLQAAE